MASSSQDSYQFISNEVEYSDIFELFSRGRLEQQRVTVVNKYIPKLLENVKPGKLDNVFNVLAVGPGIGAFDLLLLEELHNLVPTCKISWTVVEPNAAAIETFKEKIKEKKSKLPNVEFVWINRGFEEYLDQQENDMKFHFIHFVHCLYYMNEERILKETYNKLLEKSGLLLAVVGSEGDIWVELMQNFKDRIPSLTTELHYPTNEDLAAIIKKQGWPCETFKGKLDLEITEILVEGDPAGLAMLQFFLHTKEDPRKEISHELMSQVVEFFKSQSWEEVMNNKNKRIVNDDEGVLLVFKPN